MLSLWEWLPFPHFSASHQKGNKKEKKMEKTLTYIEREKRRAKEVSCHWRRSCGIEKGHKVGSGDWSRWERSMKLRRMMEETTPLRCHKWLVLPWSGQRAKFGAPSLHRVCSKTQIWHNCFTQSLDPGPWHVLIDRAWVSGLYWGPGFEHSCQIYFAFIFKFIKIKTRYKYSIDSLPRIKI